MSLEAQQLQLKMETPIYPLMKVEFNEEERTLHYSTLIRKKHEDGQYYYLTLVQEKWKLFDNEDFNRDPTRFINCFHQKCYKFIILGRVNESLIDHKGDPLSDIDSNQETEQERLTKLHL